MRMDDSIVLVRVCTGWWLCGCAFIFQPWFCAFVLSGFTVVAQLNFERGLGRMYWLVSLWWCSYISIGVWGVCPGRFHCGAAV